MVQKVASFMEEQDMFAGQICVALSGGADSVALLLVLLKLKEERDFQLTAVHVEHGIRGEESLRDAAFVEKLCHEKHVPLKTVSVDVPTYAKAHGLGDEEAARILRYEAFENLSINRNVRIALAHHMEDQAETVLFQIMRGSGLTGLGAMTPVMQKEKRVYIRPLLGVSRGEIEAFLLERHQDYCTDSTNADLNYSRNYIRNEIIPALRNVNDQAVAHINQLAEKAREAADYIKEDATAMLNDVCDMSNDRARISCSRILKARKPLAQEMVRQMLFFVAGRQKDITANHVNAVLALLENQSGKRLDLPYEMVAEKSFDQLIIRKRYGEYAKDEVDALYISPATIKEWKQAEGVQHSYALSSGEEIVFLVRKIGQKSQENLKKTYTKLVTYDKIKSGFCVRKRQEGDSFVTDAQGHHKKLKAYFIEEKIPADQREKLWIMAQESDVVWVLGKRLSEAYKVNDDTEYVLEIRYNGGQKSGSDN